MSNSIEKLTRDLYIPDAILCSKADHICKNKNFCINSILKSLCPTFNDPDKTSKNSINGLMNLGGTCYLNSFLQIYARIPEMLKLIFDTNSKCDIIESLKKIFGQLLLSDRGNISPIDLANSLNLQTNIQQDAPEFHNLFCQCLSNKLTGPNLFDDIFTGSMIFEITCSKCQSVYSKKQVFSDLNVNLHQQNFISCFKDTYSEELLCEENKYFCEKCNSKQDSIRKTYFSKLPKFLSFQLNRFSYDLKLFKRVKNYRVLQIPVEIDLKDKMYQSDVMPPDETKYELFAILLHLGKSAESGHYMAVVLDDSGDRSWIIFDDEQVKRVPYGSLDLAKVDRLKGRCNFIKKEQTPNFDHLKSQWAYMIFFRKKAEEKLSELSSKVLSNIPVLIREKIENDNKEFNKEIVEIRNKTIEENSKKEELYEEIKSIKDKIQFFSPDSDTQVSSASIEIDSFVIIPLVWLQKCFQALFDNQPIPQVPEEFICPHSGSKTGQKNSFIAKKKEFLQVAKKWFIGSKDNFESITRIFQPCLECTASKKLDDELADIEKDIKAWQKDIKSLKTEDIIKNYSDLYIISTSHLVSWKEYARDTMPDASPFNSDIYCCHDKLRSSKVYFLPEAIWLRITHHIGLMKNPIFELKLDSKNKPNCFKVLKETCLDCTVLANNQVSRIKREKSALQSLFLRTNDLILNYKNELIVRQSKKVRNFKELTSVYVYGNEEDQIKTDKKCLYLVSGQFVDEWRESVKKFTPIKSAIPPWYNNLFCKHAKLERNINEFIESQQLEIILQDEYTFFLENFATHENFGLQFVVDMESHFVEITDQSELLENICEECKDLASDTGIPQRKRNRNEKLFISYEIRKGLPTEEFHESKATEMEEENVRRSSRRKVREDSCININDQATVRDFKLRITELYGISPMDQKIFFQKEEICDDNLKLIFFDLNSNEKVYVYVEDQAAENTPTYETFFQGTRLLCDS